MPDRLVLEPSAGCSPPSPTPHPAKFLPCRYFPQPRAWLPPFLEMPVEFSSQRCSRVGPGRRGAADLRCPDPCWLHVEPHARHLPDTPPPPPPVGIKPRGADSNGQGLRAGSKSRARCVLQDFACSLLVSRSHGDGGVAFPRAGENRPLRRACGSTLAVREPERRGERFGGAREGAGACTGSGCVE